MKFCFLLIALVAISLNLNAQDLKKTKQWENYIVPVLNTSNLFKTKEIYVFQGSYPVMGEWHPDSIDSILAINGITQENWKTVYNTWKLNAVRTNIEWFKGISKEKKISLLKRYEKMKIKKYEVVGVSPVFIISPTSYMVEITRYCFGMCSSTTLYLMEYNAISKLYELKYSKNVGVL